MPNWGLVDDASSYIAYSSGWERQTGSSRQWDGGVHSTSQSGATATFRFRGTAIQVYGTVPAGSGLAQSRYSIDGGSPIQVNRQSQSSPAYNDLFLDRSGLSAGDHTLTITNAGSGADYQLDKIEWLPVANDPASETPLAPVLAPPVPTTTSTTTSTTSVQTQPTNGPTTTTTRTTTPPPDTSTIVITGTETRTEIGTSVQTIVSSYTSNGTPMATTILSTSTSTLSPASMSSVSSMMITTTDASGKEGLATVIVVVSDGHTTTLDATSTLFTGARTGAASSGLSKGALGGIIAGALVLLFLFLFLLVWLLRRVRRRRQLLEDPISTSANSQPPIAQAARGRTGNFTPFHLTAQNNTSTQGLLSAAGLGRRPASVHKPGINGNTPDFDEVSDVSSPYSPSSSYSQGANTMYATTSEGGYLPQLNFPATLHRRRPTSDLGNATLATSDAPPPSYQASLGGSGVTTEGGARTLVEKS